MSVIALKMLDLIFLLSQGCFTLLWVSVFSVALSLCFSIYRCSAVPERGLGLKQSPQKVNIPSVVGMKSKRAEPALRVSPGSVLMCVREGIKFSTAFSAL